MGPRKVHTLNKARIITYHFFSLLIPGGRERCFLLLECNIKMVRIINKYF